MAIQHSAPGSEAAEAPYVMSWEVRRVILILTLVSTLNFVDRQIINILAEAIKVDLQLSDTHIGILTGFAFAVFYALLSLPAARLAERYSRPRLLGGAVIFWSAFTMLCGVAQNFVQLFLARMGVGIGESASTPAAHSLIADSVPLSKRTSAIGLYQMGVPIGAMIGMALGGVVVDNFGWRAALLLVGFPGLIVGLAVAFTVPEPRDKGAVSGGGEEQPLVPLREFMRLLSAKRSAWFIVASAALSAMVSLGGYAFVASFFLRVFKSDLAQWSAALEASFGVSMGPVAIVGVTFGIGSGLMAALGIHIGGRIADAYVSRSPSVLLWLPAWAKVAWAPLSIASMFAPNLGLAFVFYFLSSITTGMAAPSMHAAMLGLVDARSRATVTAVFLIVTTLVGMGLGPLLVGGLSDLFNHGLGLGPVEGLRYSKLVLVLLMLPAAGLMMMAAGQYARDTRAVDQGG